MKITEDLLRANGWELKSTRLCRAYIKHIRENMAIWVYYRQPHTMEPEILLWMGDEEETLPNVTSMEALAQLEYLLSEYRIVNTAPIDVAIEAEFGERPRGQWLGG